MQPPSISVSFFPSEGSGEPHSVPIDVANPLSFEGIIFEDLSLDQTWENTIPFFTAAEDPLLDDLLNFQPTKKSSLVSSRSAPDLLVHSPMTPPSQCNTASPNQHKPYRSPTPTNYVQKPTCVPNSPATANFQKQLEEFNTMEANEVKTDNSFRKWSTEEHSKFLLSYQTYQNANQDKKWNLMSQYIQTRNASEIQHHAKLYGLHTALTGTTEPSALIVDLYEFTCMDWTVEEQNILEREVQRGQPIAIGGNILHSYFALASKFTRKSVRDIAFRLRWMESKERFEQVSPSSNLSSHLSFEQVSPSLNVSSHSISPPYSHGQAKRMFSFSSPPIHQRSNDDFCNAVFSKRSDRAISGPKHGNYPRPSMDQQTHNSYEFMDYNNSRYSIPTEGISIRKRSRSKSSNYLPREKNY